MASDILVPTPEQARILRIFCERGHLGWLGDLDGYHVLMDKLDECIKDIQDNAVSVPLQPSLDGVLPGQPQLQKQLQNAIKHIQHLESKLQQHERLAASTEPSQASVHYDTTAADLQDVVLANATLQDRIQDMEEQLLHAGVRAAEAEVSHKLEVSTLQSQLHEVAAVSAEKTQLLLQAEQHLQALQEQRSEQQASGSNKALSKHERGLVAELTAEVEMLQLQLARQKVQQQDSEERYHAQLAEAQERLQETQQQLERKGQEVFEALNRAAAIRRDAEAQSRQVQRDQLELEQQQRFQSAQAQDLHLHSGALLPQPGLSDSASQLVAAASELLNRLSSATAASGRKSASSLDGGGWVRRAAACLTSVESAAGRLLQLCPQEPSASNQQEAVELVEELLQQQVALVAALQGALDSASSSDLLLQATQSQVDQLGAEARRSEQLLQQVKRLQEERQEHRHQVDDLQQRLSEQQDHLEQAASKQQEASRQVSKLQAAVRSAENRLALQEEAHQRQMAAVQEQVQQHTHAMAAAHRQEMEAIRAQLTGCPPPAWDGSASPNASPLNGSTGHSLFPASPFPQHASLDSGVVQSLQQQLERLLHENAELRSFKAGDADQGLLLQAAYLQLSKLQHKYKALKQSYVKQTLRQHAINQTLLQHAGQASAELDKENLSLMLGGKFQEARPTGPPHSSTATAYSPGHVTIPTWQANQSVERPSSTTPPKGRHRTKAHAGSFADAPDRVQHPREPAEDPAARDSSRGRKSRASKVQAGSRVADKKHGAARQAAAIIDLR